CVRDTSINRRAATSTNSRRLYIVRATPGLLFQVRQNFVRTCHYCTRAEGRHFEQLLQLWFVKM
ncbi:hypothetical protein C0J52_08778, partial [Blattella germanica]